MRNAPGDRLPSAIDPAAARERGQARRPILRAGRVLGLVLALAAGPVQADDAPPAPPWEAPVLAEHPLVGRLWQPGTARSATARETLDALAGARFGLLGEKHDNPDHHRLQAWLIRALVRRGRRPAAVFEMLNPAQAPAIARHLAANPRDAAGLGAAVGWAQSGWPDWSLYRPIAEAALDAGLTLVVGGIDRAGVRAIHGDGVAAIPADRVGGLDLGRPLAPAAEAALRRQLFESHCGHVAEAELDPMITVQRARDAVMAAAMVAQASGAILIAGAGHVRGDYGVPHYLAALGVPEDAVVTLAFVEVEAGLTVPGAYPTLRAGEATGAFDFVWFTPRVDDMDPCEKFARSFKKPR